MFGSWDDALEIAARRAGLKEAKTETNDGGILVEEWCA